jgi:16S rRNA (cytosine1402-N4)-methyltransferase
LNYRDLPSVLSELGYEAVDGVLLDLGVSWFHLKTPERGFSFMLDGPLDMRMDARSSQTAADLVNNLSREDLVRILRGYGEESRASAIARAIEKARARGPITSTVQLAKIVSSVFPPYPPGVIIRHADISGPADRRERRDRLPPRRIRSYCALPEARRRLAVITFHSLEDRIVKQRSRDPQRMYLSTPVAVCSCGRKPISRFLRSGPLPRARGSGENPAARSAKLRVAEKLRNEK